MHVQIRTRVRADYHVVRNNHDITGVPKISDIGIHPGKEVNSFLQSESIRLRCSARPVSVLNDNTNITTDLDVPRTKIFCKSIKEIVLVIIANGPCSDP